MVVVAMPLTTLHPLDMSTRGKGADCQGVNPYAVQETEKAQLCSWGFFQAGRIRGRALSHWIFGADSLLLCVVGALTLAKHFWSLTLFHHGQCILV